MALYAYTRSIKDDYYEDILSNYIYVLIDTVFENQDITTSAFSIYSY